MAFKLLQLSGDPTEIRLIGIPVGFLKDSDAVCFSDWKSDQRTLKNTFSALYSLLFDLKNQAT